MVGFHRRNVSFCRAILLLNLYNKPSTRSISKSRFYNTGVGWLYMINKRLFTALFRAAWNKRHRQRFKEKYNHVFNVRMALNRPADVFIFSRVFVVESQHSVVGFLHINVRTRWILYYARYP